MTGSHHTNPVSTEAREIALAYCPWVFRVSDPDSPVTIIANDRFGSTLISAYRSTIPINDAHTVMTECGARIAALDATMTGIPCNKEFWVCSRPHGWVWYEVAHGSIARMDQPFNPQIRYNYDGTFTARSAIIRSARWGCRMRKPGQQRPRLSPPMSRIYPQKSYTSMSKGAPRQKKKGGK